MAIADKLTYLNETKTRLRRAINNAGGGVSLETPFRSYVGEILRDQSTLLLDFATGVYGSGESAIKSNDSQSFGDLISFSRSTTAGFFNQFGLYETAAIDQPRIDHDPTTLGSSTDTLTIGLGIKVINTDYEYPISDVVVVSYDATNFMVGKVLASSASEVTLNIVRVVGSGTYSTWSLIVRKGLLVEESRTNSLLYSSDFTNAVWVKDNGTVTAGATVSPSGAVDGTLFVPDATLTSAHRIRQTATTTGALATSFFLKAGGYDWVKIRAGGLWANFNLATMQVGLSNVTTAFIVSKDVGNGWIKLTLLGTIAATSNYYIYPLPDNATNAADPDAWSGDGVSGIYIYGAQLEVGSFPTSYIPTAGAAVTRAAEEGYSLDTGWYNPDGGTVLLEYDFTNNQAASTGRIFPGLLGTGYTNGNVTLGLYAFTRLLKSKPTPTVVDPSGGLAGSSGSNLYDPSRVVFTYDAGGYVTGCRNGAAPRAVVDLGCDMSLTTQMYVAAPIQYSGHVKSIHYVPRRLTNEELSIITS